MRECHRPGRWTELFILNSEARFPLGITKALGGVVFYDGGNVYSAINFNNFVNNYTQHGGTRACVMRLRSVPCALTLDAI